MRPVVIVLQAIKYNEEHSHGSLVALGIAIIAIFAAVNFNKVYITYLGKLLLRILTGFNALFL